MDANIPVANYVGALQEKCAVANMTYPEYMDCGQQDNHFMYQCKLKNIITKSTGINKKAAKQNAAKAMLEKVEIENMFEQKSSTVKNSAFVSKLNSYCSNEKKELPLYAELPNEDGEFGISCSIEGVTCQGRGPSKKIAKENAAEAVFKCLDLFEYFDNMDKLKERNESLKTSVSRLHEYCQAKKLTLNFTERNCHPESKRQCFTVICTVGEVQIESNENSSKKLAKEEAARNMLCLLVETPGTSPAVALSPSRSESLEVEDEPLLKRLKSD